MTIPADVPAPWGAFSPRGRHRFLRFLVGLGIGRGVVRRTIQRAWHHQPGEGFDVPYHGLRLRLHPGDNITDEKILFRSGHRDAIYLDHLARFAKPDAVFADIGANIGYYTLRGQHRLLHPLCPARRLRPRRRHRA